MARGRTAVVVLFVVTLVVEAASVPLASADDCTDDCNKHCGKDNKDPACSTQCDEICRAKAAQRTYAAATPAEKAAATKALDKDAGGAIDATGTPAKAAALASDCFDECSEKNCGKYNKDPACTTKCENICRDEVESLAFAADTYVAATPAEKARVVQAIDKQAEGPAGKVAALAAVCANECDKLCGEGKKDPACTTTCSDGCHAKAVSVAYAAATPAKREAIKKDISDAKTASPKPGIA